MKFNSKELDIWFTSDTHYGHKNIVRGVSNWEDKAGCRDFDTIEKMNSTIVDNINKYVKEDDILIHLGDWSFGGIENIYAFEQRLNVHEIHLVMGNHDTHISNNKVLPNAYWKPTVDTVINYVAKDIFSTTHDYLEIKVDKENIVLCHYPISSWNKYYRGAWMLHGHTHNTLYANEKSDHWYKTVKTMDVGVDTAFEMFGEYRPFSFAEVKELMDKRRFTSIDHHDKKTNG